MGDNKFIKKEAMIGISIGVALVLVIAIVYALYNRVHEANRLVSIARGVRRVSRNTVRR